MPVRSLAGRISKLTLNDASLQFNIDDEADPFSVSIAERNYNAFASAIFISCCWVAVGRWLDANHLSSKK